MSNPPGATVYLDGKEIGRTPVSTNFNHYGKREFRIVKQGYETKTELKPVRAPWYQWIGIDFVSEVLLPGKLTDHKYYEFELQPEKAVRSTELFARAEEFRETAHADGVLRVGGFTMTPPPENVGSLNYPVPVMTPSELTPPVFAPPVPGNPNTFVPPGF